MTVRVGINGFGRIGRNFFKAAFGSSDLELVAINDLEKADVLAHMLKYDSLLGIYERSVEAGEDNIVVDGKVIKVISERYPEDTPWRELEVDYVLESTGRYKDRAASQGHLKAGAKKVIISAPANDPDITICMGINHETYDPVEHNIVSNASCTTNCLAPVAKVLLDNFGIVRGHMTTVHAVTNDQPVLDVPRKDLRRARGAMASIIPTTTGAAAAIHLVIPELKDKFDGLAVRVPTPNVSLLDVVVETREETTGEEVNEAFRRAAEDGLEGILDCTDLPLVSIDFRQNPHSAVVDALSTKVIGGRMVGVMAWYDNEWGYSCRLIDLMEYMMNR
jgi:glyceraldehyde 3-phosphate dehydrogenase